MEILHNGFTLELSACAFPLSTDSVALADFIKLPKRATVLDLGAGCGTLGLMLCAKYSDCSVTGFELDEGAHEMALHNGQANGIPDRLTSICADLRTIPNRLAPGSYDICISNPPYFTGGPQSKRTPMARRDDVCSVCELMQAAAWALKYGGDLFFVHKPEKLAELFYQAALHKLEPKQLCLLRHKADGPVSLVLVQCRKGAKPGLSWQEEALYHPDGTPTEYYRKLYHL